MKIFDLEPGSNITIIIEAKTDKLEFNTVVVEQIKGAAIIAPVRIDGKFLSLQAKGVKISILYTEEEKPPVIWEYVSMPAFVHEGESCYKCTYNMEGKNINRRGAFRLFVGQEGVAQIGTNKKAVAVLVKDVSDNGFAFIYRDKLPAKPGEPVRLVFDDEELHFNLQGRLVRVVEVNERGFLYGCKLSVRNSTLEKYIMIKQREKVALAMRKKQEKKEAMIHNLEEGLEHEKKERT